ncbi:MAG TPA: molybdopterin molybdotransferase MoeA, partial [Micropepsaceae bacterium]|nr:molybdopterin molybdotransferase MoeA [Micropepsaceae bacterium]
MISVDEAVARIAGSFALLTSEIVSISEASGRVLAQDVVARMDQPPAPISAMDGYAVRVSDASVGAELSVIGEAPAGRPFQGRVGAGQAVRIFTGGVVPEGADAVVIQEDTQVAGTRVIIKEAPRPNENVRPRALDFRSGEILIAKGHRLSPRDIALVAAGDLAKISVTRKPRVALVATGDELSRPGEPRKEGGIVA